VLSPFDHPVDELVPHLPIAALVLAAEDIDLDAEPEEGKAGELAAAMDILADAKRRAEDAEKTASTVAEEAEARLRDLESSIASGADADLMSKVKATLDVKEEASKAARRASKARAKAEDAAREAELLGAKPDKENEA